MQFLSTLKDGVPLQFFLWKFISIHQTLSENFIMEFKDYVDWKSIVKYQNITKEFEEKIK